MLKLIKSNALFLCLSVSLIIFLSRILPHAPNFTATIAGILFCTSVIRKWYCVPVLLFVYLFADFIINNLVYTEDHIQWISSGFVWVLLSFVLVTFFASRFKTLIELPMRLLGISFGSSLIFFLVSNFGVWISSMIYSHDAAGLLSCYIAALPFLFYEVCGTLFYSSLLFGAFWLVETEKNAHAGRV